MLEIIAIVFNEDIALFFNYLPFSQVFILLLFNSILHTFFTSGNYFLIFIFSFLLTTLSERVKMQVNAQNGGHWAAVKNINEISNFSGHSFPLPSLLSFKNFCFACYCSLKLLLSIFKFILMICVVIRPDYHYQNKKSQY